MMDGPLIDPAPPSSTRDRVWESLPLIDIPIKGKPRQFLERMGALAEASGSHVVERHLDVGAQTGCDVLNFRQSAPTFDHETGGQLIANGLNATRIQVEMYASAWSADRPSRDAYVSFASSVFAPLLRQHNRTHQTRWRLRVAKPRKPYQLPPQSDRLFQRFVVTANKSSLHTLDWRRFYEFARYSRARIPDGEIARRLIEAGYSRTKAEELDALFRHLTAFKRLPSHW